MEFSATGIFAVLITVVGVALAGFGFYALYKCAVSDGRIDYCYVDNIAGATGGYEVIGHRPWRGDAHLGVAGSAEEANKILAASVVCPR